MPTPPTSPTTSTRARGVNIQRGKRQQNARDDDDDNDAPHDFSVQRNEGDADTIVVMAHVKDKLIPVHCGFGTQQVVWLGHVAIARYDDETNQGWRELGVPTKIVKDGKEELPLGALIYDVLQNHSHVYITTSRSTS